MQKISFQSSFLVAEADLDWEQAEAQKGNSSYRYLVTVDGKTTEVIGPVLDYGSLGISRAEYRSLQKKPRVACCFFVKEGGEFQISWGLGPLTCSSNAQVRGSAQATLLRPVCKDFPRRLMRLVPAEYIFAENGVQYLYWEKKYEEDASYGLGCYLKQRLMQFLKRAAGGLSDRDIASAPQYEAALNEVLRADPEYLRFFGECKECGIILGDMKVEKYSPIRAT